MPTRIESARLRKAALLCVALTAAACGDAPLPDVGADVGSEPLEATQAEPTIQTIAAELSANLPTHTDGALLVESVCTGCHSTEPPPKLAPPLNMVVRHYMEEYPDKAEAQAAMAAWVVAPNPTTSALPAHAIEQFGLMPPIPLNELQREAVAAYLIEEFGDGGMGEHMQGGMEGGMGGRMRRGPGGT